VALEILQEWPQVDLIVAPLGGGGLVAGVLCAAKAIHPNTRVVGVEPEEAADARDSLRSGQLVRREAGATIADGVRPPSLGTPGFEVIVRRRLIDDIVTVTESQIGAAVTFALRRLHLVVEPSGALPLAALHAGLLPSSRATALVLSGGNLDWSLGFRLLQAHGAD
jgi:threonine dehydratase